mmetsp:Transcript_54022/g.94865  ORF Transcript_54022/g.94865 Transcript_54022/m.94865 type:complete len:87 (+) Transcript_54022:1174-1434(+)
MTSFKYHSFGGSSSELQLLQLSSPAVSDLASAETSLELGVRSSVGRLFPRISTEEWPLGCVPIQSSAKRDPLFKGGARKGPRRDRT